MKLGVTEDRIFTDDGLTGTNRLRPGLDQALAAVRAGDTLVVPKLDRLARSVPDARGIADELMKRGVKLQLGSTVHDPTDPMGKMFFNILATFAEFESDLIRMRTREGMAVAKAKGKLKGKQPKLSRMQSRELRRMYDTRGGSVDLHSPARLLSGAAAGFMPLREAAGCSRRDRASCGQAMSAGVGHCKMSGIGRSRCGRR